MKLTQAQRKALTALAASATGELPLHAMPAPILTLRNLQAAGLAVLTQRDRFGYHGAIRITAAGRAAVA
jgi:hypothetical protein